MAMEVEEEEDEASFDIDQEHPQHDPKVGLNLEPSSWLHDLRSGGPLEMVDLKDDAIAGWSSPSGDSFQVRGEDYLMSKMKVPGGDLLLKPLALDWTKSNAGRIVEVLKDPNNRIVSRIAEALKNGELLEEPFVWAINLQVPSTSHYSLIIYYTTTAPFAKNSLFDRFVKGDDEFRNSRLKLIANIVKGPWVVKTAVGDHAVCLLGKSLSCTYTQGEKFLEVDVDIGSSLVAKAIVHLAMNYISSLTVDLAFLIEGRTKDELPEKLLGSIRFTHLELNDAIPMEIFSTLNPNPTPNLIVPSIVTKDGPIIMPDSVETREEENDNILEQKLEESISEEQHMEGSFQTRLWKSLEQRLSIDWWGKQNL